MSESKNPFADMMAQMQEMAKSFPAMEAFSPKGFEQMMGTMPKEMMDAMFGNRLNEGSLDVRTKLLLTLAGLTMQGAQNEFALRQTVRHAIKAGATQQHISETIGMMSVFAGLPAVSRASELAQDVLAESKAEKTAERKDSET